MKSTYTPYSKSSMGTYQSHSVVRENRYPPPTHTSNSRTAGSRLQFATPARAPAQAVAKQYFSFVGRTLAEENLYGFSFKRGRRRADASMDPYSPQRIELPLYFNTPKRRDNFLDPHKYRVRAEVEDSEDNPNNSSYINNQSALNMSYADSVDRILSKKRLKDYDLLALACKRAEKGRV